MFEIQGKYNKAIIYSDLCDEKAIGQIYDLCNLEIMKDASIKMMCDVHAGKDCVIGTTIYTENKQIIPNIVGSDIGCGIAMFFFKKTDLDLKAFDEYINQTIYSGMKIRDRKHPKLDQRIKKKIKRIAQICHIENTNVYDRCVGSLGGGNHFIEIDQVDEDTYALSIHSGSRLIGKAICEYFQKIARMKHPEMKKQYAYLENEDYEQYMEAMRLACDVAKENRRLIALDLLNYLDVKVIKTIDTLHNYIEQINDAMIIRKGAIRANKDEEVIIPINMKDGIIIAKGKGEKNYNYSANHGVGRLLSRKQAKSDLNMEEYQKQMKGIYTTSMNLNTLDESPMAYKPLEAIIKEMQGTIEILQIAKVIYNYKAH